MKDITVAEVVNVLPWSRPVKIYDRTSTLIFQGLATNIPEGFYPYEVSMLDIGLGHMRINVTEVVK